MPPRPYLVNVEVAERPDGTVATAALIEWLRERELVLHPASPEDETGALACEFYLEVGTKNAALSLAHDVLTIDGVKAAYVKPPASLAAATGV